MVNEDERNEIIDAMVTTSIESGYSWFVFSADRDSEDSPNWYKLPFKVHEVDWNDFGYDIDAVPDIPEYPTAILIETFTVTSDTIWDAVEKLSHEMRVTPQGLFENHDADIADSVMQYAVFGELRYG